MTDEQLKTLQAQLLAEKETLEAGIAMHEDDGENVELEAVDNHPADQATDLADEYVDQALEEFREEDLEKVEIALQAIKDGTYGTCTVCGEPIPYERLEAVPTALTCVEHASA